MVKRAYPHLRDEGGRLLSAGKRAALTFAGKTEILMACERYERRAISRRNRAMQALTKLQREFRREEAIELVGPPRPKLPRTRHNPFREQDVLRLEVEQVLRSSPPMLLRPNHTHFRSRHGLSYRSSYLKPKKRYGERAWRLMDRLGATAWAEPPLRPKKMQRRTFKRLADELWDAWLRDAHANLGVSLDRDAFGEPRVGGAG
jgi:hypothetical protein